MYMREIKRKTGISKLELLRLLADKGWDDPQLKRLNIRLLKRIYYELAPY